MPDTAIYLSRLQIGTANAIARRFTRDAVEGRRDDLIRAMDAGVDFLKRSRDVLPAAFVTNFATDLFEAIDAATAQMRRDLDEAGADPDEANICMDGLNEISKEVL